MLQRNSRSAVLAILTAALLLTGGVAGITVADRPSMADVQDAETPPGEEVIDSLTERVSALETVQFTRTTESTFQNETTTRTVRVYADIEAFEKRTETVRSSVGYNTTTVVNESTAMTYNEDENTVTEYESRTNAVLPTVEALGNESILDYEFRGTGVVDGEKTYVLGATPVQPSQTNSTGVKLTLHVDAETYFPVRLESARTGENYSYSSTTRYENVTLDEEIPESTFELDIPDNASDPSENVGFDISSYDSYDELVSATNLSVPRPDIAGNYSFEEGRVIDSETLHSVTVTYRNGTGTIGVNSRPTSDSTYDYSDSEMYETVEIGETTGYLFTSDEYTTLSFETDQSYSVYGEISEETAIDVAGAVANG